MKIFCLTSFGLLFAATFANALVLTNQEVTLKSTAAHETTAGECGMKLLERVLAEEELRFEGGEASSTKYYRLVWNENGSGSYRILTLVDFKGKLSSQFENNTAVTGQVGLMTTPHYDPLTGRVLSMGCSLAPFEKGAHLQIQKNPHLVIVDMPELMDPKVKYEFSAVAGKFKSGRLYESSEIQSAELTELSILKEGELELMPEVVELNASGVKPVAADECAMELIRGYLHRLGLRFSKSKSLRKNVFGSQKMFKDGGAPTYNIRDVFELNFAGQLTSIFAAKEVAGTIRFLILQSDQDPLSGKYKSISCALAPYSPDRTAGELSGMSKYGMFEISATTELQHTSQKVLFSFPKLNIPRIDTFSVPATFNPLMAPFMDQHFEFHQ